MKNNTDPEKCVIGIELGSTRIKAVLIDNDYRPVATGSYEWENKLVDGIWTYSTEDIHNGLRSCYADLIKQYGSPIETAGAVGISGMMHGYLPFDKNGTQLAGFRTWRNTITGRAAEELTALFGFNIPQRWSIAHLYQAMLNGEDHVRDIAGITTLAGYIHRKLTGVNAVGVGEASGIFPIDPETLDYDQTMIDKFKKLTGTDLRMILPKVLTAGENAGYLTEEGARFLDPSGKLRAGIPFCPCEGDAGTGMTATASVRVHTGNVSAGTSDFAMVVVDRKIGVHPEIDMVTTPDGAAVAMVHCNNCTGDINAWVNLFAEFAGMIGSDIDKNALFTRLFEKALEGSPECSGLMSFNYLSGEHITGFDEGRPIFLRTPGAGLSLADFMRTHIQSALASLKIGMDILTEKENVRIDKLYAHGGFFKTPEVGQRILSAAAKAPVSVMETAGEGGPYGMALLASYMLWRGEGESLADYLDNKVFSGAVSHTVTAGKAEVEGFERFIERYKKALPIERRAVEVL